MSEWKVGAETVLEIEGRDCQIWITRRPAYCDRGNFLAQIDVKPGGDGRRLNLDHQDGWPRYYFGLERAKLEIEAWLQKRGQWL